LTLNLGLRWEWFGWPEERDGRIGNFDPKLITNFDNPLNGFLVPEGVTNTGFTAVDTAVAATVESLFGADMASSSTGRRQPSSTPSSATTHSCGKSK
jgi:hypothetical protein